MTPELIESVARIARHCWRGVHWEKTPKGPRCVKEPLKRSHLERHCNGGPGIGLAPIVPGESATRIAVLDFDSHKGEVSWDEMRDRAMALAGVLANHGYAPVPFRSSGGKGIHIVLLWDEPQDAHSVRQMLERWLAAVIGCTPGTKGVKHNEVEIFPKQDSVPADGFGNMFILPLTGESLPLDPITLEVKGYDYAEDIGEWPKSQPVPVLTKSLATEQKTSSIDPASLANSLADCRSALAAIPNEGDESLDYDSWRDVIFAIHNASGGSDGGLALAIEFSQRSPKFDEAFLRERVWPYIRDDRGGKVITVQSLYARARQHGWQENILDEFVDLGALEPEHATEDGGTDRAPASASSGAGTTSPSANPGRFLIIPAQEFSQRPSPGWIIRGVLPQAALACVYGVPGSGKSFWALDMIATIASGERWQGRRTQHHPCVYVAAEDAGGVRNRIVAWSQERKVELGQLPLGIIPEAPNLRRKEDVGELVKELKRFGRAGVIVVDTFAQSMPGADENSGEDVGTAIANCRALHRATGALVVLVHHAGKDTSKGARGWSGLLGAVDAEIEISRTDTLRAARISKLKNGTDGLVLPFRLQIVPIGLDDEDEVIDSCVVEHLDEAKQSARRSQPRGQIDRIVWKAACDYASVAGDVGMSELLEHAVEAIPHDPKKRDRRRDAATRAVSNLQEQGFLAVENGLIRVKVEA